MCPFLVADKGATWCYFQTQFWKTNTKHPEKISEFANSRAMPAMNASMVYVFRQFLEIYLAKQRI